MASISFCSVSRFRSVSNFVSTTPRMYCVVICSFPDTPTDTTLGASAAKAPTDSAKRQTQANKAIPKSLRPLAGAPNKSL